mgnify:CR=1 FL=1
MRVPGDVMTSISPMESPQGALFLCRTAKTALPERLPGVRYLVLDGVQDPGNVGCADPWNPKTVRATMGACFRLPVYERNADSLAQWLGEQGIPLYATALREDTVDLRKAELSRCAVVIGSEGRGISDGLLSQCEKTLKIPMRARCESLNAAAAATVVLWEMGR